MHLSLELRCIFINFVMWLTTSQKVMLERSELTIMSEVIFLLAAISNIATGIIVLRREFKDSQKS